MQVNAPFCQTHSKRGQNCLAPPVSSRVFTAGQPILFPLSKHVVVIQYSEYVSDQRVRRAPSHLKLVRGESKIESSNMLIMIKGARYKYSTVNLFFTVKTVGRDKCSRSDFYRINIWAVFDVSDCFEFQLGDIGMSSWITVVTCVILTGMPRLPFFPENRFRGEFGPRHHWPEQGNRLRWVSRQNGTNMMQAL